MRIFENYILPKFLGGYRFLMTELRYDIGTDNCTYPLEAVIRTHSLSVLIYDFP